MDYHTQSLRRMDESLEQELSTEAERNRETTPEKEERLSKESIEQQLENVCTKRGVVRRAVQLIELDQFEFVEFSEQIPNCAAIVDLNGPTVAMIISKKGVVIANVAPFENFKTMENVDTTTSAFHANKGMTYLMNLYRDHRHAMFQLSKNSFAIIVAAEKNGDFVLGNAVQAIKETFAKWTFASEASVVTYEPYYSHEASGFQRSSVFVDGRPGGPDIYLNGQLIWHKGRLLMRSAPSERLPGNPPSSYVPLESSSSRNTTSRTPSGNPSSSYVPLASSSSRNPTGNPSSRYVPLASSSSRNTTSRDPSGNPSSSYVPLESSSSRNTTSRNPSGNPSSSYVPLESSSSRNITSRNHPSSYVPLESSSSRNTTSRNPADNPPSGYAPLDSSSSRNTTSRNPSGYAPLESPSSRNTTSRNPSGNLPSSSAPLESSSSRKTTSRSTTSRRTTTRDPTSRAPSAPDDPFVNTFSSDHPSEFQPADSFEAQYPSSRTYSFHHTSSRDPPSEDPPSGKGKSKERGKEKEKEKEKEKDRSTGKSKDTGKSKSTGRSGRR